MLKVFKRSLICCLALATFYGSTITAMAEENTAVKKGEPATENAAEKPQENSKPNIDVQSDKAILYDMHLNKVIYEKNADVQAPTASLAKVMNMYLASEALAAGKVKKEDLVTISAKAWKTGGSRMFIEVGKQIPFWELFKGTAIVSGNDSAVAIAEHLTGTTEEFVNQMNAKAGALGMKNTKFLSVNGLPLDDAQTQTDLSTARDLSLLAVDYLKKFKENLEVHKMPGFAFDNGRNTIEQKNRNTLLGSFAGADGLKTGWVDGHYNIIGTAERDGVRLVVVIMSAPNEKVRGQDASKLLKYGFDQYNKVVINKAGDMVQKMKVYKTKDIKETEVIIKDDIEIVLHSSQQAVLKQEEQLPKHIVGGKKQGDVVGKKVIYSGDKVIYTADIVLKEDLPKGGFWQNFFDSIALLFGWVLDKLGSLF